MTHHAHGWLKRCACIFMYPTATLILSGGHSKADRPSNALIMSQAAIALGVPKHKFNSLNTIKARMMRLSVSRQLFVDKTAFLVICQSSATSHGYIRTVGAYPIPAPTDFQAKQPILHALLLRISPRRCISRFSSRLA